MTRSNPVTDETLPGQDYPEASDRLHSGAGGDARATHEDASANHPHIHSEESLRRLVNQLSRIEGHVRGIKVMLQESRACPEVLIQLAAVRGAIDRVSRIILDEHLTHCIARAATEGNIELEIEQFQAALDRFLPLAKPKNKKTSTQKP